MIQQIGVGPMASKRTRKPADGPVDLASTAQAPSEFYFAGVMFVLAVLMPWYFELPLNFNIMDPEFNPLIFVPVVFGGIGAISLSRSVFAKLRSGKFGAATLSPVSAQRGALFRPALRTDGDIEATGDFVFVLKCIRKVRGGDDFEGHSTDKVLWTHTETSPATSRSSQGVSASFRIPPDMPPTGPDKGAKGCSVRWQLSITAPVRGVNFHAAFSVSVG